VDTGRIPIKMRRVQIRSFCTVRVGGTSTAPDSMC
jgi:hypothetical protein